MKFGVKRIGNQAHKSQKKGVMENAPNCDSQKKLIVIKYKGLEYTYSFCFLTNREETTARQILRFVSAGLFDVNA
jgi:hypothetical protein